MYAKSRLGGESWVVEHRRLKPNNTWHTVIVNHAHDTDINTLSDAG